MNLTPLVHAVWMYLVCRPGPEMTMSREKYDRLIDELPMEWRFVDRATCDLGIEHHQLKGCIIRPLYP